MKQEALIAGVGMTRFARHLDRTLSDLAHEAINGAIADAGISKDEIQAAWAGSAAAPITTGQIMVSGQMILRKMGIGRIPVVNVENACATAATAFHEACAMVTCGMYDVVLAFGVDKLFHEDKAKTFSVFNGAIDTENPEELYGFAYGDVDPGDDSRQAQRSLFMDIYARLARDYSKLSGATVRHFAEVSVKNSIHGSLNPNAQFQAPLTIDAVLTAKHISPPLTLPMCSPLGDGAAASIIVSEKYARKKGLKQAVRVRSTCIASSFEPAPGEPSITQHAAFEAYWDAGIAPSDIDCVELHDASSPAELICYEALGLCGTGEGPALLESGATRLGGRVPVNTSGGLVRKGHPIGATGLAQIYELTHQLRGTAGKRQVENARVGIAENGGGFLGHDAAAVAVAVLSV